MLAAVVLAIGTAMIQGGFINSAGLFGRSTAGLEIQAWSNEQIWNAQEALLYSEAAEPGSTEGEFSRGTRVYHWSRDVHSLAGQGLYAIRLTVDWVEGSVPMTWTKEIHVFKKDKVS